MKTGFTLSWFALFSAALLLCSLSECIFIIWVEMMMVVFWLCYLLTLEKLAKTDFKSNCPPGVRVDRVAMVPARADIPR